jgi:hypothetical protein
MPSPTRRFLTSQERREPDLRDRELVFRLPVLRNGGYMLEGGGEGFLGRGMDGWGLWAVVVHACMLHAANMAAASHAV